MKTGHFFQDGLYSYALSGGDSISVSRSGDRMGQIAGDDP